MRKLVLATVMFLFAGSLASWGQTTQPAATTAAAGFNKYAYIVYFTPADRDPQPDYRERLDRIHEHRLYAHADSSYVYRLSSG